MIDIVLLSSSEEKNAKVKSWVKYLTSNKKKTAIKKFESSRPSWSTIALNRLKTTAYELKPDLSPKFA